MDVVFFAIGFILVSAVAWDVFESVVVPRPTPGRYRIAPNLIRFTWHLWRKAAMGANNMQKRERLLGGYAPTVVLLALLSWIGLLILGFGFILFALRGQLEPQPRDVLEAAYAAGTSTLTIGFGDFVPTGALSRFAVLLAAGSGLGIVALVITFLFGLYGALQRRELLVVTLDARAGAPPSGVQLLETFGRIDMVDELPALFGDWEVWAAEVLDSHLAYPILGYFRSSHDNESWVSSLGAVMDAATLVLTTISGVPRGRAEMMLGIGQHLVEDVANSFGFPDVHLPLVARMEFEEARDRLFDAGFELREPETSWEAFVELRSSYAARLNALATFWMTPPAQWIGDRSMARHAAETAGGHEPLLLDRPIR